MMPKYIDQETAIANIVAMTAFRTAPEINSYVEKAVYRANGWIGGLRDALIEIGDIPAADVEPIRHAYWIKRMEHGVGRGYEVYTPIWSCSDCGRDYDPGSCSIIKYCYICGAKMDGGQDDVSNT